MKKNKMIFIIIALAAIILVIAIGKHNKKTSDRELIFIYQTDKSFDFKRFVGKQLNRYTHGRLMTYTLETHDAELNDEIKKTVEILKEKIGDNEEDTFVIDCTYTDDEIIYELKKINFDKLITLNSYPVSKTYENDTIESIIIPIN